MTVNNTVVVGTGTAGSQYLRNEYPVVEGLDAGTTKQTLEPNLEEQKELP